MFFHNDSNDVYACSDNLSQMYDRRDTEGKKSRDTIRILFWLTGVQSTKTSYGWTSRKAIKNNTLCLVRLTLSASVILIRSDAEMLQIQISFGSKEAVWSLWNMLKKARTETLGGEPRVSDLAIAQQLTAEWEVSCL